MKYKKGWWANILCDVHYIPYRMIVTDGQQTSTIPISNSTLKACKKAAMDVYSVAPGNILVSIVEEK